jgi:hypothetical protein
MSDLKESGVRIGVVACTIMKRELDRLLQSMPEVTELVYLEVALHCYPQKMKQAIKEQIASLKDRIDVLFLGYGYCQSLKGIEDELDIPVIMPQMDDCIQILLTPQKYGSEIRKEVGTWFMTPGWSEAGAEMVIKETHADRVVKYGKDPLEIAKRLFVHYKRGLYIDTGVGNNDYFIEKANEFCKIFVLKLEKTEGTSAILELYLEMAKKLAVDRKAKLLDGSKGEVDHDG